MPNYRKKKPAVETPTAVNNPAPIEQRYFRVAEAANYLRITTSLVRVAYRDGKLRGAIHGKRLIFCKVALDEFFAGGAADGAR
jgi:hypothetical protein